MLLDGATINTVFNWIFKETQIFGIQGLSSDGKLVFKA